MTCRMILDEGESRKVRARYTFHDAKRAISRSGYRASSIWIHITMVAEDSRDEDAL